MDPNSNVPSSANPNENNDPNTVAQTPENDHVQPAPTPTPNETVPQSGVVVSSESTPTSGPMSEPTPTMTPATGEPVVSGASMGTPVVASNPGGKRGKKKLLLAGLVILAVVGLSAGYVFGYYIPNKPENVWKSAMANTGKAYDKLSAYATKKSDVKGYKLDGSYNVKGSAVSDGTFTGKSYGSDSQMSGSISAAGLKVGFDVRTLKSSGDTPDLYFKLTGLQGLGGLVGGGDPTITSAIESVNNQWFVVDHTLFEQLGGSANNTQLTQADMRHFLQTVGTPSKQYLFTEDTQKSVLEVKSVVGSEKKDGRNTYHYKVAVNQAHFKQYVSALCTSIKNDKVGKLLMQSSGGDCTALAKDIKASDSKDTADVWVDKHTKLVHVVRITDPQNKNNYVEISQDYQGGDTMPFGLAFRDKENGTTSAFNFGGTLNTKTNTFNLKGDFTLAGDFNESGTVSINIEPSNDSSLKVVQPQNAKTLIQLLDSLGLGQLLQSSSTGGGSASAFNNI